MHVIQVSTLAVEWIEIRFMSMSIKIKMVSTLAVEWIEIHVALIYSSSICLSPPSRWSGLKYAVRHLYPGHVLSPPSRWSGLKSDLPSATKCSEKGLHPRGGVD